MKNSERVGAIYQAFGSGDIPTLLEALDENVDCNARVGRASRQSRRQP